VSRKVVYLLGALLMVVAVATPLKAGSAPAEVWVDNDYTQQNAGGHQWGYDAFATVREGVEAVADGGTVHVAAGMYDEGSAYWSIAKPLSLIGEGSGLVTINRSAAGTYGLHVGADNVTLQGFTLIGPSAVEKWAYGLKIEHMDGLVIHDVAVVDSGRSGIDLNTVSGAVLTDVSTAGNKGAGLALTACADVAVTGLCTGGNAWSGVAIFTSADGIVISDSLLAGEEGAGLYVEGGAPGDYGGVLLTGNTFAENRCQVADLVGGVLDLEQILAENTFDRAVVVRGSGIKVPAIFSSIQEAVNQAAPGDTVEVLAGTYQEQVVINKDLVLQGVGNPVILAPDSPAAFTFPESSKAWEPVVFAYGGTDEPDDGSRDISGHTTIQVDILGLTVDGNDRTPGSKRRAAGILFRNVSGRVEGNVIRNMNIDGQETFGVIIHGDSEVTVTGNHISGWSRGGIGIQGDFGTNGKGPSPDPTALVTGNTVLGPGMDEDVTWAPNGIQFGYGAAGEVTGNEVSGCGWPGPEWSGSGIIIVCTDGVLVEANEVTGNETGIAVLGWMWESHGATDNDTVIRGNWVEGNTYGISLQDKAVDTLIQGNHVLANLENGIGLCNFYGNPPTGTVITGNVIAGNNPSGAEDRGGLWVDEDVPTVNAGGNWWGHATGPQHETLNPEGQGDRVIGDVDFGPWDPGLIHLTAPTRVRAGSSAEVRAWLSLSDGTLIEAPEEFEFSATRGSIESPVLSADGYADTTWQAPSGSGRTTISAAACGLAVETQVQTYVPAPPPPPPEPEPEEPEEVPVTVEVPESVYPEPVTLTVSPADGPPDTAGFQVVGEVYDIELTVTATGDPVEDLEHTLTIVWHFTAEDLAQAGITDPALLRIWYWDLSAEPPCWVALPTVVDEAAGTLTAAVDHLTPFAVMVDPDFPALPDAAGHLAEAEILRLASVGAVNGFEDGTFRPDLAVTRAQFAKLLARSLGLEPGAAVPDAFADAEDVPDWALPWVSACLREGIMMGSDGLLRPNDTITRAEAAAMAARALDLAVGGADLGALFADAEAIPDWAEPCVAAVVEAGVMEGMPGGVFDPSGTLTRARAVRILSRAMDVR